MTKTHVGGVSQMNSPNEKQAQISNWLMSASMSWARKNNAEKVQN